ncbi:MAG: domain protein beta barrel domain protein [Actinomycetia bacterium]|nr:domain protein beta barrel domain protein [Actinomycetes bacterium]
MKVTSIWRYPVKSMQGEHLEECEIGERGIVGDRMWGVVDRATGFVLTARREAKLLFASARYVDTETVEVRLPDGRTTSDDRALSRWLDRDVTLQRAVLGQQSVYETPTDNEQEDAAPWTQWQGPAGTFHDSTRTQVSLVSEGSLGAWAPRRFRPNLVVSENGEDGLFGQKIAIGGTELRVTKRIDRCVMTTRPQPDGIERDIDVLRTVNRERGGCVGIGMLVVRTGEVKIGDGVQFTAQPT